MGKTALQCATQNKNTKIVTMMKAATYKKREEEQKNETKSELIASPDDDDTKLPPPTTNPTIPTAAAIAAADAAFADLIATEDAKEKAKAGKTAKNKATKEETGYCPAESPKSGAEDSRRGSKKRGSYGESPIGCRSGCCEIETRRC